MTSEADVRAELLSLVRDQRVASLGTFLDGHPLVSLVLFDVNEDLTAFHIHISRLAQHARGLSQNSKVGLMIAQADGPSRNPQTLARISIQGLAEPADPASFAYEGIRDSYLRKFPKSQFSLQLPDFFFVRIQPLAARLITGFGGIHDLDAEGLTRLARD